MTETQEPSGRADDDWMVEHRLRAVTEVLDGAPIADIARQKLRPGVAHAGKTVTLVIEETCFRVLDGEVEISTHARKGDPVTRYVTDTR